MMHHGPGNIRTAKSGPSFFLGPLTQPPPRTLFGVDKHGVELSLHAASPGDIDLFLELSNNPKLNRFESLVDISREFLSDALTHVQQCFENTQTRRALWKWAIKNGQGSPVGGIELSALPLDHVLFHQALMIGFTVLPDSQRNGYASGAMKSMIDWIRKTGLVSEIQGWCHKDNAASQHTMLKLGMKKTLHTVDQYFPRLNEVSPMEVWSAALV